MQHIERGKRALAAYHAYLQSDHDYRVWAEVLNMNEVEVGSVDLLDGQVNFARPDGGDGGPDRTASVVLSDPEGALAFGTSYAEDDDGVLWVDRLLRLKHQVEVPDEGIYADGAGTWTTTCMVGVPLNVSRDGGEVSVEMADKSVLADQGVRARTYRKGANVRNVLVSIMKDLTGERHIRVPKTKKKLSRPYTVGMGEDQLTPWRAFKRIAGAEMGWRAYYSADGYATAESTRTKKVAVPIPWMLKLPDSSTSFTDYINYVKVTSRRKMNNRTHFRNKKTKKIEYRDHPYLAIFTGVTVLPKNHRLSERSLARNGVVRTMPMVITDDNLKNAAEVNQRAKSEIKSGSDLENEQAFEIMPVFHLDTGDKLRLPMGVGRISFDQASIPLGTGGNMTIGAVKWVSRPVTVRRVRSRRVIIRPKKKKGGKKNDA